MIDVNDEQFEEIARREAERKHRFAVRHGFIAAVDRSAVKAKHEEEVEEITEAG